MKIILSDKNYYILRFDKDEEVISGLQKFMADQSITAFAFNAIGACQSVELGYFNPHLKDYRSKPYVEDFEIVSFSGNGALADGQPVVHAHGALARNDFSLIGGHIFKIVISVTCEVFLTRLDGTATRVLNPDFNLKLLG